ncbi:hypothetical protein NESM_000678800 [Novymonas esmeraldas]|uniref:Uncharacterized protein n=1 Tax=Novymonas esmeraldas TaxID=1808958 RepID=A0AAW0ETD6_9TRYP
MEITLKAFCEATAIEHRRRGHRVPLASSNAFAYHQWLETAQARYVERQLGSSASPESAQAPAKRVKCEVDVAAAGNTLADGLAQQLTASLVRQNNLSMAPASLRHAAQEGFPMPQAAADMPAFLALAEAAIRLTLWAPEDGRLAQLASRLRPSLRALEEQGIIRLQHGCFPSLQVIMDLLSWRIIAHRWTRLTPEMRQVAVDGVLALCSCLDSVATEALRAAVDGLLTPTAAPSPGADNADAAASSIDLKTLDTLIGYVSASVPFQFSSCADLVELYPAPVGVLRVPGEPTATSPSMQQDGQLVQSVKLEHIDADDEADIRVGDLLGGTPTPVPTVGATPAATATPPPPGRPSSWIHTATRAAAHSSHRPPQDTGTAPRQLQAPALTGQRCIACASRYHARYADPAKHASRECAHCATCHLMEILFRCNTCRCPWNHWPTSRKIQWHLKGFPQVMKLAQERFAAMQRGDRLTPTDEVPL